jgi:hypothetical protein
MVLCRAAAEPGAGPPWLPNRAPGVPTPELGMDRERFEDISRELFCFAVHGGYFSWCHTPSTPLCRKGHAEHGGSGQVLPNETLSARSVTGRGPGAAFRRPGPYGEYDGCTPRHPAAIAIHLVVPITAVRRSRAAVVSGVTRQGPDIGSRSVTTNSAPSVRSCVPVG